MRASALASTLATTAALLAALLPHAAPAQDLPIPYTDDRRTPGHGDVSNFDHPARDRVYAPSEDPATGLGAELLGGLFLLDSSRGQLADVRWGGGARATWDYGRLLADLTLHEALFVDATWAWTSTSDGTQAVHVTTQFHFFTVAPAYEIPFGERSPWGFYFQLGGGVAFESSVLHADIGQAAQGFSPLFQYGVGLRGRPLLTEDGKLRLTLRLEATRFLRQGYLSDTLVLLSAGLAF